VFSTLFGALFISQLIRNVIPSSSSGGTGRIPNSRVPRADGGCPALEKQPAEAVMLTDRQQQILDFIRDHHAFRGIAPSRAEIQQHFGFASPNAVADHLKALERKGVLQRGANTARSLVLTRTYREGPLVEIPIYGTIPAGLPNDQTQEPDGCISVDVETLRLPKGSRVFALKVRGDSMTGAGIFPGDIVVLEFREPRNGEVVAALLDGETTLKRFVIRKGRPFLKAENPQYTNLIPARELVIQGVQVALLRVMNSQPH
jgi:repressor LexA